MFGDTKLSGIVKQEVSPLGELEYVGVMYFYGSKLPVRIRIKPSGHTQKGKLLYYIYNYLPVSEYNACTPLQKRMQKKLLVQRQAAEAKAAEVIDKLGYVYERQKIRKQKQANKQSNKRSRKSRKAVH